MAGDTGTISGNLPRLFMRVLAGAVAVGACGCLLSCSRLYLHDTCGDDSGAVRSSTLPPAAVTVVSSARSQDYSTGKGFRGVLNIPFVHL